MTTPTNPLLLNCLMRPMLRFAVPAAAFCLACSPLRAQTVKKPAGTPLVIHVGDAAITLPPPDGFALMGPEATVAYEFQAHFISEGSVQYAFYLPKDVLLTLPVDSLPYAMGRSIRVQAPKSIEGRKMPPEFFRRFKEQFKNNTLLSLQSIKKVNSQLERTSEELVELFKYDPELSLLQIMPVKGFVETPNSISSSMYMKMSIEDKKGAPTKAVGAGTYTLLYLKGKIIFLYVYGREKDLEWTQEVSKRAVTAILAANPEKKAPAPAGSAKRSR